MVDEKGDEKEEKPRKVIDPDQLVDDMLSEKEALERRKLVTDWFSKEIQPSIDKAKLEATGKILKRFSGADGGVPFPRNEKKDRVLTDREKADCLRAIWGGLV